MCACREKKKKSNNNGNLGEFQFWNGIYHLLDIDDDYSVFDTCVETIVNFTAT